MPKVELSVRTKDGQTILLSEGDHLVKEVTIECNSGRCASRHGQDKPLEVAVIEGELIPEVGDQWMSIILPERSPQYAPMPMNFCSAQCARDFLIYDYRPPMPRTVSGQAEYHTTQQPPVTLPPNSGAVLKVVEPTNQADGAGDPGDEHN